MNTARPDHTAQDPAADTTPTTAPAAGGAPSATVPDTDPSEYVASMSPQRVETFNSLAQCESSGDWSADTGNGFYGGLQFSASTWRSVGGTGLPHQHSRVEQIRRAAFRGAQIDRHQTRQHRHGAFGLDPHHRPAVGDRERHRDGP